MCRIGEHHRPSAQRRVPRIAPPFRHAILVIAAPLTCMLLYYALVAGSLTTAEVQQAPLPLLPGSAFIENAQAVWTCIGLGRLLLNSATVALGIAVGKLTISLLSDVAITYFRFRFRGAVFWLIFLSRMLPVEVRIVTTFEAIPTCSCPYACSWSRAAKTGSCRP